MSASTSWETWLRRSPVYAREMRQAMRSGRGLVLVVGASLLFGLFMLALASAFGMGRAHLELGPVYFQVFFSLAYFATCILAPPLAAITIAAERDARTWEAMILTGLPIRSIARAKFSAVATALAAFLAFIAPSSLLCVVLGGVPLREIAAAFAVLAVIALIAIGVGCAIGATRKGAASATLVSLSAALLASLALYFAVGVGFSFLAHATWAVVPGAVPVWLPLAYVRAPMSASYLFLLVAVPFAVTWIALWFCYEVTLGGMSSPSDDRSSGLKVWFVAATPVVATIASVPGVMTQGPTRGATWMGGLAGLVLFVTFAAFVLTSDALAPSPRVVHRWQQEHGGALRRLLGPGLVQTFTLALIAGLSAIGVFAIAGGLLLWRDAPGEVPPAGTIALLACAADWGAFFTFVAGLLVWSRVRARSARAARLLTLLAAGAGIAAPWIAFLALTSLSGRRADEALLAAAPSPAYAVAMANAIQSGEPHLAVSSALVCALGWAALGLTLFGLGARRATREVAEQQDERTRAQSLALGRGPG